MKTVINSAGTAIDFDAAVALMDNETRETLHDRIAPCTEQEFFDAYCAAHAEKYSEEWEPNKANPVF